MSTLMKGIDVSYAQGRVDWSQVKNSGVQFALIRAGYGRELSQKDVQFENNYSGCKSNNIPCGAYWYSYAMSPEEAVIEANTFLSTIKGKSFEFPVYYDVEEAKQFNLGKTKVTAIIKAFLETVEKAGYWVGIYMSTSYLLDYVSNEVRDRYAIWVAQYSSQCTYTGQYGIWQYGIAGHPNWDTKNVKSIKGVSGQCDVDYCYIDYPSLVKKSGLNFITDTPTTKPVENTDVVTYSSSDKTQLTEHFNVSEFKCKCGGSHNTLISKKLVEMLEKLFEKLDCSKIIVNSGYRCSTHDKNVGGNGSGQHTKGTAADVVCYAKGGSIISSKIVSCVAQDLGFTGIANITADYQAIHLDVRSGSKWYGNEVVNNNTVTNDFYSYYGIKKPGESDNKPVTPPPETEEKDVYTVLKDGKPFMKIEKL